LETERLVLRRPRLSDGPALLKFLGDAGAMRYTLEFSDLSACRRHIAAHECQRRKVGYGPSCILRKEDGQIIGFGGLCDDPFDTGWGPEINYHFVPSVWGNGYATELTRFCLKVARDQLGLAEVRAFAHPNNAASRRVLKKTGFDELSFIPEMNRHLYSHRLVVLDDRAARPPAVSFRD
jgi:ribosomal-protein-alanine N-acetyltransferase